MAAEHHEESAFVMEILADPSDEAARAIYADWLEERGDPRAEVLRIEAEMAQVRTGSPEFRALQKRLRRVRRGVDPTWIQVITRTAIENCRRVNDPHTPCPGRWERMQPTQFPGMRMCWECDRQVEYCQTMREVRMHVRMSRKIAVSLTLERKPGDLMHPP